MAPTINGPRSPPPTTTTARSDRSSDSTRSPFKQRVESRQRSNVSCSEKQLKGSVPAAGSEIRYSVPVLTEEESARSYQPHYFKPLNIKRPESTSRKPVPETPDRKGQTGYPSISTPISRTKSITSVKDTPSPKLLTEVSEEDFLRRSHLGRRRYPSQSDSLKSREALKLEKVVESPEPYTPTTRNYRQLDELDSNLHRDPFKFEALVIRKVPGPAEDREAVVKENNHTQNQSYDPSSLEPFHVVLDSTKNPRPNALYNPSLFSTQHGIASGTSSLAPVVTSPTKRKPVASTAQKLPPPPACPPPRPAPKVTFAVTAPSEPSAKKPQDKVERRDTRLSTPTKPHPRRSLAAPSADLPSSDDSPAQPQTNPTTHLQPISATWLSALSNTASADESARLAGKLRRVTSLARIRQLTPGSETYAGIGSLGSPGLYSVSSTGEAAQSLADWISDLCNARMPPPPPSNPTGSSGQAQGRASSSSPMSTSGGFRNPTSTTPQSQTQSRLEDLDTMYSTHAKASSNNNPQESNNEDGVSGSSDNNRNTKPTASEELTVMIDDMLSDMNGKFHAITSEIMAKMDDMSRRIDNLEATLNAESAEDEHEHAHEREQQSAQQRDGDRDGN